MINVLRPLNIVCLATCSHMKVMRPSARTTSRPTLIEAIINEPRRQGKKHGRDGARKRPLPPFRWTNPAPPKLTPNQFGPRRTIPASHLNEALYTGSVILQAEPALPNRFGVESGAAERHRTTSAWDPAPPELTAGNAWVRGILGLMPLEMPFRPFLYK